MRFRFRRSWSEYLLGIASGPALRGAARWRELLEPSAVGLAAFEEGYARVAELARHCPEDRHLIHDDLLNRNVLVDEGRITAVLDWGSSMHGDFLYDLAKFTYYAPGPWFAQWANIDFKSEALAHFGRIGLEVPKFDERLTCYELRMGLGDLAYSAYRKNWDQVAWAATRISEVARA